jgi:hypothetical protein
MGGGPKEGLRSELEDDQERIEIGRHPVVPVLTTDPTGEKDIFLATGVMPFEASLPEIYGYVEGRAQQIGMHVKRNRGKPPNAKEENLLSVEEKALVILGRAIGVTWRQIKGRIIHERVQAGLVPPDRQSGSYHTSVIEPHRRIVTAIHADMLDALEVFSPLVGGSQRIIFRAKMIEYYRQRIFGVARLTRITLKERERRIVALDKAMDKHLRYFDALTSEEDIAALLSSPSEQIHSQSQTKAEDAIEAMHKRGEITDEERIDELRKLRHGELKS